MRQAKSWIRSVGKQLRNDPSPCCPFPRASVKESSLNHAASAWHVRCHGSCRHASLPLLAFSAKGGVWTTTERRRIHILEAGRGLSHGIDGLDLHLLNACSVA